MAAEGMRRQFGESSPGTVTLTGMGTAAMLK
jgi:hypothetical protein